MYSLSVVISISSKLKLLYNALFSTRQPFSLWRSPRSREECELYCYSVEEQRRRGII